MRPDRVFARPAAVLGMLATLAGCTSPAMVTVHDVEGRPHKICRNCLELAEQFLREGKPQDAPFGPDQAVFKRVCADCGTDMEIHEEAKTWVQRCPRCSIAGIAIAPVGVHEFSSP